MSDPSNNHIKMKLDDGCQYAVIQFLQRPKPHIPPYVCIPHSWIRVQHSTYKTDSTTPVSIVSFPDDEDASITERRILQNDKASERWKLYSAIVRYESNTFEDACENMAMMAKADIAQERSNMTNDLHLTMTPSTSRSGPSLELNTQTNSQNSTHMNKRINMDAVNKERPMVKVSNLSKAFQITNVIPPILVKPLSSEIPRPVSGETETVIRRNSIQSLHNSRDSLQHGHNLQPLLTNHEIGIPRIDPNEPAIPVEHGSQRIVDNQLHASPSPLILKQLLLDNVDPESFSREYESLPQGIKTVHNKQTSIADQKQDSYMRPVASIVIENPVDTSVQPKMVIKPLPGNQNFSRNMYTELPPINSNKPDFDLINVASSYSVNQSDMAVKSLMESKENSFQENNIDETVASKNSVMQENNAFDSMLNIWINNAADLFQAMHNNVTQSRVVTNNFEKAFEKMDGQFEYFANLFDNLRKLTKRNTNEDTLETQKPPDVDKENMVYDCDMKECTTESTKSANLSDNDCSGSDEWENDENEDDNEDDNQGEKVRGRNHSFTLPPEYKRDDTKWTLKYQESDPKRGIVELIPGSNVYIDLIRLGHCKRESQDYKKLARKLLEEIFSQSALSVCSLTGARANAFSDKDVRPGLDEHARLVILEFVEKYGLDKGWGLFDQQSVISSQRSRLQEIRYTQKKNSNMRRST